MMSRDRTGLELGQKAQTCLFEFGLVKGLTGLIARVDIHFNPINSIKIVKWFIIGHSCRVSGVQIGVSTEANWLNVYSFRRAEQLEPSTGMTYK